jgi:hypothetical protein
MTLNVLAKEKSHQVHSEVLIACHLTQAYIYVLVSAQIAEGDMLVDPNLVYWFLSHKLTF